MNLLMCSCRYSCNILSNASPMKCLKLLIMMWFEGGYLSISRAGVLFRRRQFVLPRIPVDMDPLMGTTASGGVAALMPRTAS